MVGPMRKQRTPPRCKLSGTKFKTNAEVRSQDRSYVSNIVPSVGTRKAPLLLAAKLNLKEDLSTKKMDKRIFRREDEEES
jgi:hypothetical protein